MSVDEAVAYARSSGHPERQRDAASRPTRVERQRSLLTAREREIAALLGHGRTNRQIADELVTAERTIETHTRNMREKLGLATRAQLIAWAVQQRLTNAPD